MANQFRLHKIVRAVEGLGGTAFLAGVGPIPDEEMDAALRERGIVVAGGVSKRRPFFLTPTIFGTRELLVRRDITRVRTPAAFMYVRARALLDVCRGLTPAEADAGALCIVLHLQGCREGGAAWQVAQVRQLAGVRRLWSNAPLRELLAVVNRALRTLESRQLAQAAWTVARLKAAQQEAREHRTSGHFAASLRTYHRMYCAARACGAWEYAARARLGAAATCISEGRYPRALRHIKAAGHLVKRHDLRHLRGEVLHDLFALAAEWGHVSRAERIAYAAFEAYGPANERIPSLAKDVGFFWREHGYHSRAVAVFSALLWKLDTPVLRLRALSNLLWSAGAMGDRDTFAAHEAETRALVADESAGDAAAFAHTGLAWGLYGLGRNEEAVIHAQRALELASDRGEARTCALAENVLRKARRREAVRRSTTPLGSRRTATLAAALVASLSERDAA